MLDLVVVLILILWLVGEEVHCRRAQRAKEAMSVWHRIYYQLSAHLPSAFGCSGIDTPDIDDAFVILYKAKKLMRAAWGSAYTLPFRMLRWPSRATGVLSYNCMTADGPMRFCILGWAGR
jgi:hypothetical protein